MGDTMKPNTALPKLPLPELADTLERYLLCVKAIVPEGHFDRTQVLVNEFGKRGGIGERLQSELRKFAEKEENWAYEWWLNDMYLENRAALPVNSNPGMVLPRQQFSGRTAWLSHAARMAIGILDFKLILDARALPVEMARGQLAGQALCMEQYYRLLQSYRLPGKGCDRLLSIRPETSDLSDQVEGDDSHIVVIYRNQFFVVDVNKGDYRINESDLTTQLQRIVRMVDVTHKDARYPMIGIITSENRDIWANAREILLEDAMNRVSLDNMERCIFVLCLDSPVNHEMNETNDAHQMLHGCGPHYNSGNRWYDKTIQLIVCEDGNVGLTYEHSVSEGIAVKSLIEHLLEYISQGGQELKNEAKRSLSYPVHLKWNVDARVHNYLEIAKRNSSKTAERLDLKIMRFKEYGKNYIKNQNMSPDAFVQVALQLTYYRIYGHLVSTYESASLRRFRQGRVENIRAATIHVLELAKSLFSGGSSRIKLDALKMNLLKRAIKVQTDNTKACITGNGFDNHLLALQKVAEELGVKKPDIFEDASYALSNYFVLSTSQIPTVTDSFMCYGAVVPDGYGISYNPKSDSIAFCIGSFRDCPSTNSTKFADNLFDVLRLMKELTFQWNRLRRSSSVAINSLTSCSQQNLELLKNVRKVSLHWPEIATSVPSEKSDLRDGRTVGNSRKKKIEKRKTFTNLPIKSERSYQKYPRPVRQWSEILTSRTWVGDVTASTHHSTSALPLHLLEFLNRSNSGETNKK